MEPSQSFEGYYTGDIICLSHETVPQGWGFLPCDGRQLNRKDYNDLYKLIQNVFGGDGTTFHLPDLRGVTPIGCNEYVGDNGGNSYPIGVGSKVGQFETTLTTDQLPAHDHSTVSDLPCKVSTEVPTTDTPDSGYMLSQTANDSGTTIYLYQDKGVPLNQMQILSASVDCKGGAAGSGEPFCNMQPYIAFGFYICTDGIAPFID